MVTSKNLQMKEKSLLILGQIGGYGAGVVSILSHAKDVIAFVGVVCGATLSVIALMDRLRSGPKR